MAHQVAHHFQQVGQRFFFVDKEAGRDVAGADQVGADQDEADQDEADQDETAATQ